jgi:hypothetical protein
MSCYLTYIKSTCRGSALVFERHQSRACANSLERSIIVVSVVKGEIPNLVLDTKDLDDLEDFCCNARPSMTAHFRNPQNDLVRLAIFIPKEVSNAVQGASIPRPPSIKGDVYKTRALLKGFDDVCRVSRTQS